MTNVTSNSKTVVKNTLFLYFRMMITILVGLYASRVVLQTLGESDYGIYSLAGSIVLMLNFLNTGMMQASQRFIAYAIGAGDEEKLRKSFGASLYTHIAIAIICVILAESIGLYIVQHLNIPADRFTAANWVYQCSIATFVFSVLSVPYNSCIIAHEKMNFYAYVSILDSILKLVVIYLLIWSPVDKLISYAILILLIQILVRLIYVIYCKRHFEECARRAPFHKNTVKDMFSFASWSIVGNMGFSLRDQGTNIILNFFFGTIMNAARGIASQLSSIINGFATNITLALNPPIVKSYASGDIDHSMSLVYRGCRAAFSLLMLITIPFLCNVDYILNLWLGKVPENTSLFVLFILLNSMIYAMSQPITVAIQATGEIKVFQIVICALLILELGTTGIILYFTRNLVWSLIPSTIVSFAAIISRFAILKHIVNQYSWNTYIVSVILRCCSSYVICYTIAWAIHTHIDGNSLIIVIAEVTAYFLISLCGVYWGILNQSERRSIVAIAAQKLHLR